MKTIIILLAVAVCYSEAGTMEYRPNGVKRSYTTSSSTPTDFFPLNEVSEETKQFSFSTQANPIKFHLTKSNGANVNGIKFEILPEDQKAAVADEKDSTIYIYVPNKLWSTEKPNIVVVFVDHAEPKNGQEVFIIGGLTIQVNNAEVFTYDPPRHPVFNLGELKYISFVAANDGNQDEFFYKSLQS